MTPTTASDAQEIEATEEYTSVDLDGNAYRVKLPTLWRPSYLRALRAGDVDTWAEGVIHADDLAAWTEADPTLEDIGAFANSAMTAAGEAPGKSGGPSRSSTRTRRK